MKNTSKTHPQLCRLKRRSQHRKVSRQERKEGFCLFEEKSIDEVKNKMTCPNQLASALGGVAIRVNKGR